MHKKSQRSCLGLEPNSETITLVKDEWTVPETYGLGKNTVVPMGAGKTLAWKMK